MKSNTKIIMETWRRYLKEGPQDFDNEYSELEEPVEEPVDEEGYYDEDYNPEAPDPNDDSEIYGYVDEEGYDQSGRIFQSNQQGIGDVDYGRYEDPEGQYVDDEEPVVDDDLSGDMYQYEDDLDYDSQEAGLEAYDTDDESEY